MKKLLKTRISILLAILILCFGGLAQASPITIEISGVVTSASGSGLPSTIYKDVNFTGTYTYESSTDDSGGGHHIHDAPYGITISVGGYEFKTAPNHIGQFDMWIINDDPVNGLHDYYIVFSDENVSIPSIGPTIGYIRWDLRDSTYDALSSGNLPATAPVLSDWDYNVLEIYGFGLGGLTINGTVTQAVLVPEPLTSFLMMAGVLFLRRRR
ncbi:MAG: PEP-CTERM sorting domain-containing protein [Sedimentisphaerales bacterium]